MPFFKIQIPEKGNRFLPVTPLSQRYNNVWMNGGAVPSSEADSRAFSFDIIPSSQIDNLTIVKDANKKLMCVLFLQETSYLYHSLQSSNPQYCPG